MTTVDDLCCWLEERYPSRLAEEWDNVGLLLGDRAGGVTRIMTCLTLTPESVEEAVRERAELVVTHHPLPFRPIKALTSDSVAGNSIWKLARAGVAVYSPHTALDSAAEGINQQLADQLGLRDTRPLAPDVSGNDAAVGAGRWGNLPAPESVADFGKRLQAMFPGALIRRGPLTGKRCQRVAVACGSGGSLLSAAVRNACDTLVTGEATFHTCLEAAAQGVQLWLVGHYQSERFALEGLAERLRSAFAGCQVWASHDEHDPLVIFA